jgi:hypothetical protein
MSKKNILLLALFTLFIAQAPAMADEDESDWNSEWNKSLSEDSPFKKHKPVYFDEKPTPREDRSKIIAPRSAIEPLSPFDKPRSGTLSDIQRMQLEEVR